MDFVGARCEWIPWDEWGMVTEQGQWDFKLGENHFEQGALLKCLTTLSSMLLKCLKPSLVYTIEMSKTLSRLYY